MSTKSENLILLDNPEFPKDAFRLNAKQNINNVGSVNFGAGVMGKLGLLKGKTKHAPYQFTFDANRWTEETAKEWVEKLKASLFCTECIETFDNGELWVRALVTKLHETFTDGRIIVGLDIPAGVDIPVRDRHTESFGEIVGLTSSDHVRMTDDGRCIVDWKVTNDNLEKLLRNASYPEKLFQYSPEVGNVTRNGQERSGDLVGIAITGYPAWNGSRTENVFFERDSEGTTDFNDSTIVINDEAVKLAEELIASGKIDNGSWDVTENAPTEISELKKYALSIEKAGDPNDPGSYGFAIGGGGLINTKAVLAVLKEVQGAQDVPGATAIAKTATVLSNAIQSKEGKSMAEKQITELLVENATLKKDIDVFEEKQAVHKAEIDHFEKQIKEKNAEISKLQQTIKEKDEKFEQKVKDYDDLKEDNDAKNKIISKFEEKTKEKLVDEVFEAGVEAGRYDEEHEKDVKKDLFEKSIGRLEEKRDDFEAITGSQPEKEYPGVPRKRAEKMSTKEKFESLFG